MHLPTIQYIASNLLYFVKNYITCKIEYYNIIRYITKYNSNCKQMQLLNWKRIYLSVPQKHPYSVDYLSLVSLSIKYLKYDYYFL